MSSAYGNLGDYARITEQAKHAGGVEELVRNIAKDGANRAAPQQIGIGIAIGIAVASVGSWAVPKIPAIKNKLARTTQAAEDAKSKFRLLLQGEIKEPPSSGNPDLEEG